jgi:hypothetical protein
VKSKRHLWFLHKSEVSKIPIWKKTS